VCAPEAVPEAWKAPAAGRPITFVGDGALAYADVIERVWGGSADIVRPVPALAPAVARLAAVEAGAGRAVHPHGIRPIYIRRPDAELARDRRAGVAR
jgi:tRNA A37 threonylcarbamoyladenosine modification protein TsaB